MVLKMNDKFEMKIIKLTTGEDIICFYYSKDSLSWIKYPKLFYANYDVDTGEEELILVDWLPKAAYYYQEVSINSNNVLFSTHTNVKFGYNYLSVLLDELDPESELALRIKKTLGSEEAKEAKEEKPQTIH